VNIENGRGVVVNFDAKTVILDFDTVILENP